MAHGGCVCPQNEALHPQNEHKHAIENAKRKKNDKNSPTAAFLLPENMINARTNTMLSPQMIMFAMLPKLPLSPAFKIPHSGFTPTGALDGVAERPVKTGDGVVLEASAIWNRGWLVKIEEEERLRVYLAIEKVTPGIGRYLFTLNTEIAKLCHLDDGLRKGGGGDVQQEGGRDIVSESLGWEDKEMGDNFGQATTPGRVLFNNYPVGDHRCNRMAKDYYGPAIWSQLRMLVLFQKPGLATF